MKQLRLFDIRGVNLSAKLAQERKESVKVNYHWNGDPW